MKHILYAIFRTLSIIAVGVFGIAVMAALDVSGVQDMIEATIEENWPNTLVVMIAPIIAILTWHVPNLWGR